MVFGSIHCLLDLCRLDGNTGRHAILMCCNGDLDIAQVFWRKTHLDLAAAVGEAHTLHMACDLIDDVSAIDLTAAGGSGCRCGVDRLKSSLMGRIGPNSCRNILRT